MMYKYWCHLSLHLIFYCGLIVDIMTLVVDIFWDIDFLWDFNLWDSNVYDPDPLNFLILLGLLSNNCLYCYTGFFMFRLFILSWLMLMLMLVDTDSGDAYILNSYLSYGLWNWDTMGYFSPALVYSFYNLGSFLTGELISV